MTSRNKKRREALENTAFFDQWPEIARMIRQGVNGAFGRSNKLWPEQNALAYIGTSLEERHKKAIERVIYGKKREKKAA